MGWKLIVTLRQLSNICTGLPIYKVLHRIYLSTPGIYKCKEKKFPGDGNDLTVDGKNIVLKNKAWHRASQTDKTARGKNRKRLCVH